ncbi:MAG: hypothetical protein QXG48_03675 [Thermofilaceae archaeon]
MSAFTYERMLTWRVVFTYLLVIALLHPVLIYNWLTNGIWGLAGLNTWAIILILVWLTARTGNPLTKSEIFAIRLIDSAGLMFTGYYFAYLLRNMYFVNSEIARLFGVVEQVPPFFAPLGSDYLAVSLQRTFFHRAWLEPVFIIILVPTALTLLANYILGLISFSIYVREERLEFPWASWDARLMLAFGERDAVRMRTISLAILIGALYGFMTSGMATILRIPLVPRMLVDFTGLIENVMPGAAFAFTTDFMTYVVGFILPLRYTALQLAASVAVSVFGNYYVTVNNLWPPEANWQPGRGVLWNFNMSTVYFWNSFAFGWGLAAALLPLIVRYKTVVRAFTGIARGLSAEPGAAEIKWLDAKYLLPAYLLLTFFSVAMVSSLAPGFPIHILLLFTLGLSFLMTLLQTHSAGILIGVNIPYLREALIYFSGYRGLSIWFIPAEAMLFTGGSGVAQQLLQARIVGASIKEYTKAYFLLAALGLIGSFVFVSLFWYLFPIPGYAYPYTLSGWPVEAMNFWRWQSWLWTGYLFRRSWIFAGFSLSAATYFASEFLLHDFSLPVAFLGGLLLPIHTALAYFLGSLISRFITIYTGEKWWNENRGYIAMGLWLGDSIVSALLMLIQLITRAIWLLPY